MPLVNAEPRPASPLRLLGVERDEVAALAWSFLYFFALLTGYYVLRPVRDAMGALGFVQRSAGRYTNWSGLRRRLPAFSGGFLTHTDG